MENTTDDIPVQDAQQAALDLSGLKCYDQAGNQFGSADSIPADSEIKISGNIIKNAALPSDQLVLVVAIYDMNGSKRLIDCEMVPIDFNGISQVSVEGHLNTPSNTANCFIKAFVWNRMDRMSPVINGISLPQ